MTSKYNDSSNVLTALTMHLDLEKRDGNCVFFQTQ
jgi:hypothetical protein